LTVIVTSVYLLKYKCVKNVKPIVKTYECKVNTHEQLLIYHIVSI